MAFFTMVLLTQTSCSDIKINSLDIPELSQSIFIVPEGFYGEPYTWPTQSKNHYVNINEKLRICGVYSLNGTYIPSDEAIPYYNTHKWTIDTVQASATYVYYSFDIAGVHDITFETVDHLGDTLISHAKVYVNTPTKIDLQTPANNYNQVDGENKKGIELAWSISGIDPWETSYCELYAGYSKSDLWKYSLGDMDCLSSVNLLGKLNLEVDELGEKIDHSVESSTIYWGVRAIIKNENGIQEQVYSDIFNFSTKLENKGDAIIEIPVTCQFNQYPEKTRFTGAIISAAGDTLSKISGVKANTVIHKTIPAQSNVKVVVCDSVRTEYGCDSMFVDLAPSTKTITDTLVLHDKIKPNLAPVQTTLPESSKLEFYILDNGAGINASKIQATMNGDSLQTIFEDNILTLRNTCKKECNLIISAEDYARNKTPYVYWNIKMNESIATITGPYAILEDNK